LIIGDEDLDRSACRNVTTIAEATGFDQDNFDRAVAPIDVVGAYLDSAKAAESGIDQVNRDLGWLYVTTDDQTNTANMVEALTTVIGFGTQTALCVPQINAIISVSCTVDVPAAYEGVNATISDCTGRRGDDECLLTITGEANGQTYDLTSDVPDIRGLLGGKRRVFGANYDFTAAPLDICFTGNISNDTSVLELNNFCLTLDVSESPSDVLATFADMTELEYAGSQLDPALDALIAVIKLEVGISGVMTIKDPDDSSLAFSMSNMDMGFIFDREVINGAKVGPIFNIFAKTLSRTNPAGETLNSIGGKDLFRLDINNDVSVLTSAKVENNIGLPPVVTESNIRIEGLGPLVDVLKDFALGLVSFSENPDDATAPPVVTAEQWEQIIAEVEAGLVYGGTITSTIQENVVDESGSNVFQTYVVELTSDGSLFVSNLNDNAELNSETAAMQIYLSGATGYIYAGETLVATAHLGNSQDGMLLSFADGTQRSYTNANPSATSQLDSFLDFITILFPPAEEPVQ
jgi:hypothetical protein